jgi:mannosyltransferase OCH1-like enzyme
MQLLKTIGHLAVRAFRKLYTAFNRREVDLTSVYTIVSSRETRIPNSVYQTWKKPELPSLHAYY